MNYFDKINTIINYLKENSGYDYKLYNHLCSDLDKSDSNIVEYAEDIEEMIKGLLLIDDTDLPF